MKWESVTSSIGQSAFALWNNGKQLVTLAFNNSSNAARIEFNNEKRVFLLRKEGWFKNTTVLTNEYGIPLGRTGSVGQDNFIEVNNERYFYQIDQQQTQMRIFKGSMDNEVAVCGLSVAEQNESKSLKYPDKTYYSLLMTLCWYLFQPGPKAGLAIG